MTGEGKMAELAGVYPVLIGLMGSGKSSIGRRLAAALELPLVDLDAVIVEQVGRPIPKIFAERGEEGFRDLETDMLARVIGRPAVLATGGGIVMRERNRALLRQHPPVIWLKADPEFLAARIKGDANRPLIAGGNALETLRQLADLRYPLYEACADFVLPRGDMKKSEALREILAFLHRWRRENAAG